MRQRKLLVTVGAAVVVASGLSVGALLLSAAEPVMTVDQARARAMMPAIIAYLQGPAYSASNGQYSAAAYRAGRVRWLCNAAIVFIRADGTRWQVGMDVACGDYARQGSSVIMEDGGDLGHVVMTLSGGHGRYQVLTAAQEPGISPVPAWIDQHFPASAAAEVNQGLGPMASTPDKRAWRAFGCTTRPPRGTAIALGWPCTPR